MPVTLESLSLRCCACAQPVETDAPLVNHGNMVFHHECAPGCSACGRHLGALDAAWRCEAVVVSEPWGYSLLPVSFLCAGCWGTAPRDPPTAQG